MKNALSFATLAIVALSVSGCGSMSVSSLLGDDKPSATQAQAAPDLAMPPDLQLRPPGQTTAYSETTTAAAPVTQTAAALPTTTTAASVAQPQADIYERYGISKFNPDGTPKTQQQLQAELKKAALLKKQQQNPNYGTIFNIGNIFTDG